MNLQRRLTDDTAAASWEAGPAGRPPPLYRYLDTLVYMVAGYEGRNRVLVGLVILATRHCFLMFITVLTHRLLCSVCIREPG